ncbi:SWIM zinc finger family protein, partial [Halothiobacillus sp.]|uniref:SWIM zinc finger family protein n=1 Tax=Halothiobacillus sp. TaxID=1891311 RepID=UPI002639D8F7
MTRPIHLPFTLADITDYFGAHEIKKAQPYIRNAVRLLHVENSYINAEVQGTARTPYDVHINFYHDTGDKVFFDAECSCPVGYQCKHAAATLIAALNYQHPIPGVPPETLAWLDQWQQSTTNAARAMKEVLVYLLRPPSGRELLAKVYLYKVRVGKDGLILESANAWYNIDGALRKPPRFVQQADLTILHLINHQPFGFGYSGFSLENDLGEMALDLMRDTGRLYIEESHTPLKRGADRAARLQWRREGSTLRPELLVEPAAKLFALSAFWYLDARTGELGRVN